MRRFVSGDPFQKQEFPEPNLCREVAWNETLLRGPNASPHVIRRLQKYQVDCGCKFPESKLNRCQAMVAGFRFRVPDNDAQNFCPIGQTAFHFRHEVSNCLPQQVLTSPQLTD